MERFQIGPLVGGGVHDWENQKKVEGLLDGTLLYYWWARNGSKRLINDEDQYLAFILGPESPWKAIFPYLVTKTPKEVQDAHGVIINTPIDVPARLLFNFLMATRLNRTDEYVLDFQKKANLYKVHPRLGFLLTGGIFDQWNDSPFRYNERQFGSLMPRPAWVLRRFADGDHETDDKTIRRTFFRGSFNGGAEAIWYDSTGVSPGHLRAATEDNWCRVVIAEYERRKNDHVAKAA